MPGGSFLPDGGAGPPPPQYQQHPQQFRFEVSPVPSGTTGTTAATAATDRSGGGGGGASGASGPSGGGKEKQKRRTVDRRGVRSTSKARRRPFIRL